MEQLPEDAVMALNALKALKAQQHYAGLVLEDEQKPVKPKGVFVIGESGTTIFGHSGKGKSLLPRILLREAQEEMERREPFTTKIAKAIMEDSQVTVETADRDWLRTFLATS